jgi:hypothetical protein
MFLVRFCSLKFPAPYNNFIFDAMCDRVWDIAQTRYGARCMRTCLERKETSHYHKVRLLQGDVCTYPELTFRHAFKKRNESPQPLFCIRFLLRQTRTVLCSLHG